ncbi:MAG: T9SS type A sorting domain-containing protein [candidate division Zixibacteria bacterium]|nr:T9SS type A sorting domain-containing protein [candidate division Zixibacteria bacterium]
MNYLSKSKFNALKILYKRYIANKRIIQSIVFFSILIMSIAFFLKYSEAGKIGTCYNIGYKSFPRVDANFTDKTSIESFRFRLSWEIMDAFLVNNNWKALADSIVASYPDDEDIEKIFMFKFYHPTKMVQTGTDLVYKVNPDSIQYFKDMCAFLGDSLGARGIHTFVLHNEPNIGWFEIQGPPPFAGGRKWMSGYDAFAEQCSICIEEIEDASACPESLYIIFGSFCGDSALGVDTIGPVKGFTDAMNLDMVDCIDFHVYKPTVTQNEVAGIASKIKAFAENRSKEWSVLETAGPLIQFPERYYYSPDSSVKIFTLLKEYVFNTIRYGNWTWGISDSIFVDSLYTLTRQEDECHFLLPENWYDNDGNHLCPTPGNLEDYKINEFDHRVPTFDDSGAVFVHWFAAWRHRPYHYHNQTAWGCYDMDCEAIDTSSAGAITGKLIKQSKYFPRCILDPEDTTWQTPFAEHIQDYIEGRYERTMGEYIIPVNELHIDNYPNVFNASTRIEFALPSDGHTKLEVYDLLGKRVEVLIDEYRRSGNHSVIWNAERVASGIYFCRLTQGEQKVTKKMGLVK